MIGPPLALYVHIPYCRSKCPYCGFRSVAKPDPDPRPYVSLLMQELRLWRTLLAGDDRPLVSVFIGGGTPSLFPPEAFSLLLHAIGEQWTLVDHAEVTMEANPDSLTLDNLCGYRAAGINRLSLGIQSFNDARLTQLGRIHDRARACQAILWARQAGFSHLNLDLIYATPGHTVVQWQHELEQAMAWQPEHLSCYELTIEPDTPFGHRGEEFATMEEETRFALWQQTRTVLEQGGWTAYEISNFARPGHACRHNQNYWRFGDYLGLGVAAHGKITDTSGRIYRYVQPTSIAGYGDRVRSGLPAWDDLTLLSVADAAAEYVIMGLRTTEGISLDVYRALSGNDFLLQYAHDLTHLLAAGMLQITHDQLMLTEQGVPLADSILARLLG